MTRVGDGGGSEAFGPWIPLPPFVPAREPVRSGLRVTLKAASGLTKRTLLKHPFTFQCPPTDAFGRDYSYSHTDYDTLDRKQKSRRASKALTTMSFSTLVVDWPAPFALIKKQNPLDVTEELLALLDAATPFRLVVAHPELWSRPDVNMLATLRSVHVEERAGELDSRYFDVQFVEWRKAVMARVKTPASALGPGSSGSKKGGTSPRTPATVVGGKLPASRNTLHELSKYYYGTISKWSLIAKASGLTGVTGSTDLNAKRFKGHKITVPKA